MTAAMLHHVINPPGRPLAGVLLTRPEDDGRGSHIVNIGTIVDDVTGTCDELVDSDVTHTAEVDAVASVLHACSVVHLIGPDRQAQLRNSVIQRLHIHQHSTESCTGVETNDNCSALMSDRLFLHSQQMSFISKQR